MDATPPAAAMSDKVGFLTRVVAFVVDTILVAIAASIITAGAFGGDLMRSQALSALLGLLYYVYFSSASGGGQTLGMRMLNVKVVRTDGSPLTVTGAVVRYVGLIISFFVFFIGVIWVAFDAQKQGWHDKIAGTYVVRA